MLSYLFEILFHVAEHTCATSEKGNFALNFIIKQNPFRSTNGATRCVADMPPIDKNQDYGAPHPYNSLSQHCGAAGDLRLLF